MCPFASDLYVKRYFPSEAIFFHYLTTIYIFSANLWNLTFCYLLNETIPSHFLKVTEHSHSVF